MHEIIYHIYALFCTGGVFRNTFWCSTHYAYGEDLRDIELDDTTYHNLSLCDPLITNMSSTPLYVQLQLQQIEIQQQDEELTQMEEEVKELKKQLKAARAAVTISRKK